MKFIQSVLIKVNLKYFLVIPNWTLVISLSNIVLDWIYNLCNKSDIIRERNIFYNSFNSVLRKLYNVNIKGFLTFFKIYCMKFYGSRLWFNKYQYKTPFKQFLVPYYRTLKMILNVPWSERNHVVCWYLDLIYFSDNIYRVRGVFEDIFCIWNK